jgi:hypothetical protein
MTTQLISNSPHIAVQKTTSSSYINMQNASAGMVRYNGNTMEVYDGYSWVQLSEYHTIETSSSLNNVIDWASKKMAEEAELKELCKKFPALQKAMDNLEMIKALVASEMSNK